MVVDSNSNNNELLPVITGTEDNPAETKHNITEVDEEARASAAPAPAAVGGIGVGGEAKNETKDGNVDDEAVVANNTNKNKKLRCIGYCCCCFVLLIIVAVILGFTLERNETDELYFSTCDDKMGMITTNSSFGIGEIPSTIEPTIPGTEQPNFDAVPIYQTYFEQPELYHRLIIHVVSLERAEDNDEKFEFVSDDPEAILTVTAKGPDTGSSDYFTIGQRQFRTTGKGKDTGTTFFEWDEKVVLIYKAPPQLEEGNSSTTTTTTTESIEFYMIDKDKITSTDTLMKFSVPISELPQPGGSGLTDTDTDSNSSSEWMEYSKVSEVTPDYDALKGSKLIFRMKVMDDYIINSQNINDIYTDSDTVEFREHVLTLASGDHALVQAWTHHDHAKSVTNTTMASTDTNTTNTTTMTNMTNTSSSSSSSSRMAVLWVMGYNDGFMHPHVLKDLFLDQEENDEDGNSSFDVYILHWRFNGRCLARGFVDNPLYNSHNPCGDIDLYNEEVGLTMEYIKTQNYDKILGYAHSTGSPILLNYLIEMGDDAIDVFDGFIFNSPFLDWANVGGWLAEFSLKNVPNYFTNSDVLVDAATTPSENKPIEYLGQEIMISSWGANHIYPFYYSEWADRSKIDIPVRTGFVRSANSAFDKINSHKGPIIPTTKPVLVLTSESDDVLSAKEINELSKQIHPDRKVITYRYNFHDIFLSSDYDDVHLALNDTKLFLKEHF